jgi:cytokinin dehydrogenase
MKRNCWSPEHIESCRQITGVSFSDAEDVLKQASSDFGGLEKGYSVGVAYPASAEDVSALLKYAHQHNLAFTIRNAGYSQGGQTLSPLGGATLDCSRMNTVNKPDPQTQTLACGAGATWRQVIETSIPHGLLPKVIPFFPDLSIGGTLSVGGIGGNSHRHGCAAGHVNALEGVTGSGIIKTCSPTIEPDLLEATLCGLGRCSIMTTATLELRPCKPFVASYILVYTDYENWVRDITRLQENFAIDYLEAFCQSSLHGMHHLKDQWKPMPVWLYNIQVSFEYDSEDDLTRHKDMLQNLNHHLMYNACLTTIKDFTYRLGQRTQTIKSSVSLTAARPWFECLLPLKTLSEILPDLLARLPLILNDALGYRIFFVNKQNNPFSFMIPATTEPVAGFAVLPMGIAAPDLDRVLAVLNDIQEWLLSLGGKRYISGWLGSDTCSFWQNHYGSYYERWKYLKNKYDAGNCLQSILLQTHKMLI